MSQFSKSSVTYSENAGITVFAEEQSLSADFFQDVGEDATHNMPGIESQTYNEPLLPGSHRRVNEIDDDFREPEVEKTPTTWRDDGDVKDFMNHVKDSYPHKIPKHDGKSMVGAERAVKWLTNFGKEISQAVKKDETGVLDDAVLEEIRVSVMKDILMLKEHVKKLDRSLKGKLKKKAGLDEDLMKYAEEIEIAYNHGVTEEIKKVAAHPRLQIFVSPFERAIAGIVINSVVSGGKPLEEVYDFLKEKYDLTDREELAIMQVIMDSGFPIFKDRGTFSSKKGKDSGKNYGIEFIKNYFA